jgi:putative tricarboxylic transport membrane protein
VMLLIFNLPMVGVFVRILYLPMRWLLPMIIVVAASGVLSKNGAILDVLFMCGFGAIGYYFRKYDFPLAPIILGAVLGDNMEIAFRQSMMMMQGDIWPMFTRPIVATLFVMSALSLFLTNIIRAWSKRNLDVEEDV